MDFEVTTAQKPDDWPINAREQDLELIDKAIDEYETTPGYRTREVLITMFSDFDLNQTAAIGEYRICEYEVALINKLYIWGLTHFLPSLRCYLYNLVGQTARMQKMFSYSFQPLEQEESIGVKAYEKGLWLPLRLYYFAYQSYTVFKDKPFAEKIIEVVNIMKQVIQDEDVPVDDKEFSLDALARNYSTMLNDLSYFHGNKKEGIWKFDRDELKMLFALESELCELTNQNPLERPLHGVLMTQISNFILKSRHDYNEDYICKYVSENAADSSFYNHEIWMRRIEDLNDEREGHVIKDIFADRDWVDVDWIGELDFTPVRKYYVSSFAKSVNNPDMKSDYGSVVFGFKGDRIADLISPIYEQTLHRTTDEEDLPEKITRHCFSMVTAYDVLYDEEELKEEMNYLFNVIDLFAMSKKEKNEFLNSILQYWLLSAKDPKWSVERERRYVIFLYDDYDYQEMEIDDGFLKIKTSLFILPDFLIGKQPKKREIRPLIDNKRKSTSYRKYMFCRNCFNRDYDVVAGFDSVLECPICGSQNIETVIPRAEM